MKILLKMASRDTSIRLVRVFRGVAFGCLVLLSSCAERWRGSYFTSGVSHYTGDGKIQDTSDLGGAFPTRGFLIALPKFDLASPYTNVFRLDGLPIIEGKQIGIYFLVGDAVRQSREANGNAAVRISLLNGDGANVANAEGAITEFIWASPVRGLRGYALYQPSRSFFSPIPNASYRLKLSYSPGTAKMNAEGQVYLWCSVGGS